jgi:Ni,Fe-hydrogenase I small subunit
MTHSPCNRVRWNRQSSKTRAGMPCMGCTELESPFFDLNPGTVFKTQTVMGVPKDLPTGVDKTGYGRVTAERARRVVMHTVFGGRRIVDMLVGEQLPRIC